MRDQILEYYKTLLAFGWMTADDDGNVSVQYGDLLTPATIDGKRLVLPTRDQMKNKNWENRVGFHPIRELYNLGISDVTAALRDQFVSRLNTTISYFMKELIDIANNQSGQKKLTTAQSQVLNALTKCDDTLVRDFKSLSKSVNAKENSTKFIHIHVRRGATIRGQTYGRAGIVKFPIYEELVNHAESINGVKISKKNREMLIKLFEFILPSIGEAEVFDVGVNSKTAPFLESLIRTVLNVADEIVDTAAPYLKIVDMPEILKFPEDIGFWKEIFDSKDMAEKMAKCIPPLNANEDGEKSDKAKERDERDARSTQDKGPPWDETPQDKEPARSKRAEPHAAERHTVGETKSNVHQGPRGRLIIGAAAPSIGDRLGKALLDQDSNLGTDRAIRTREESDRLSELAERERKLREREQELDRQRRDQDRIERDERRREREDEDRERRERRDREYRDRDRDRDYRGRDRDDRDDRDRGDRRRTGDIFEDNPTMRALLRDEEDRSRYGRGRDRYDERDYDRGGPRRVRDIRDRGYNSRYEDDRDYRDRDRYYRGRR